MDVVRSALNAASAQDLHLPLAPDGAAAAFGVIVEQQAADCCFVEGVLAFCRCSRVSALTPLHSAAATTLCMAVVQVHCRDRPRLLLDIASALADLELQVAASTSCLRMLVP